MRHFSHRRKKNAFSSRDSFPYNESRDRHDSYPQFRRSSLGTPGTMTSLLCPKYGEKRVPDYESDLLEGVRLPKS